MKRSNVISSIAFLLLLGSSAVFLSSRKKNTSSTESSSPQNSFYKVFQLNLDSNTYYKEVDLGFSFTSISVEYENGDNLNSIRIAENGRQFHEMQTDHCTATEGVRRSSLLVFDKVQSKFSLRSGSYRGSMKIYLFYAPDLSLDLGAKLAKANDPCLEPSLIEASTWRNGLPDPIKGRTEHQVQHCVVHHSATSNSSTDYTNVVRNIYLYHTQNNGWDDVGYNYLVAPDGTIYEGRDKEDIEDGDNVKGAHFCGKNSKTMGICMLGNFMEQASTDSALSALENILTWKCLKEGIDPMSSTPHPSSADAQLDHIAGHRQGCATACPGDSLFDALSTLKSKVRDNIARCSLSSIEEAQESKLLFSPNPASSRITLQQAPTGILSYSIADLQGRLLQEGRLMPTERDLELSLANGIYNFMLVGENGDFFTKRLIIKK